MFKYCFMADVLDKNVVRVFPCEKNTSAGIMNLYINYLFSEGFDKDEIKNPVTVILSTTGESDEQIIKRLEEGTSFIRRLSENNIFLGIEAANPDELFYISEGGQNLLVDDLDALLVLLKGGLDTIIDIKLMDGIIRIVNNRVVVTYDETDSFKKNIFSRLSEFIELRHDIILSMQKFSDASVKIPPKRFIKKL